MNKLISEIESEWKVEVWNRYFPIFKSKHPNGGRLDDSYFGEYGIYTLADKEGFTLANFYNKKYA